MTDRDSIRSVSPAANLHRPRCPDRETPIAADSPSVVDGGDGPKDRTPDRGRAIAARLFQRRQGRRALDLAEGPRRDRPHVVFRVAKQRGQDGHGRGGFDLAKRPRRHPPHGWIAIFQGRPDRLFIKLHCHGAADGNRQALLGEDLPALFSDLEARYNDGQRYRLHYVTARELFNVVKATEAGAPGNAERLVDWLLPPPCRAAGPAVGEPPVVATGATARPLPAGR